MQIAMAPGKNMVRRSVEREMNELIEERANQFDGGFFYSYINQIAGNRAADENPLAALLSAIENLNKISEFSGVSDSLQTQARSTAEKLEEKVPRMADERTALGVAFTYHFEGKSDMDGVSEKESDEVTREAKEWLENNPELAESVNAWDKEKVDEQVSVLNFKY